MKKFVNLSLFLISGFLSLLLLEFLIRVFLPVHDPSGMMEFYHNQDGVPLGRENTISRQWRNTGDYNVSVRINQYGFRDTKDVKLSTVNDIFVVGDSFSFGYGVEEDERYSNLLEAKLGVPVYNISIPTDLDGYEKLIGYAKENEATINTLIIGITMENDLVDYSLTPLPGKPAGEASENNANKSAGASNTISIQDTSNNEDAENAYQTNIVRRTFSLFKYYLFTHSATYNALISTIYNTDFLRETAIQFGLTDRQDLTVQKSVYSDEILQATVQKIMQLQNTYNISDITLVIIPSRALWVGDNQNVEAQVHDQFINLLQQANFDVIDLRPAFEANGQPMDYFFKVDGHWNSKGHQKAAEIIYDRLSNN